MREVLKIMGLTDTVHQLSWLITATITFLFIAVTMTFYTSFTFLRKSNLLLLLLYFVSFCLSIVSLSFLVSVFFSNSKLAAICGPVVLIFAILPKFVFFGTENTECKFCP